MVTRQSILVGVFGAPHGVRGEIRLKSYTDSPVAIASYAPLKSQDGRRSFTILKQRLLKDDMLVVQVEGIEDRSAAEALTNLRLYVDRGQLPPADEEEFYHADLVGLQAETERGETIGPVTAVHNFGAGDLLEIAPQGQDAILVSFTRGFVPHVDLAAGRLVVADAALAPGDADAVEPEA